MIKKKMTSVFIDCREYDLFRMIEERNPFLTFVGFVNSALRLYLTDPRFREIVDLEVTKRHQRGEGRRNKKHRSANVKN